MTNVRFLYGISAFGIVAEESYLSLLSFFFHHPHFRRVSPLLVFPDGELYFHPALYGLQQLLAVYKKLLAALRHANVAVAFVGKEKLYDAYGHESGKLA